MQNDRRRMKGFVTRERWLLGKTPVELASILGFAPTRMAQGAEVWSLTVLPRDDQFEFAGHTYWAGGKPRDGNVSVIPKAHADIDKRYMKGPEERQKRNVRANLDALRDGAVGEGPPEGSAPTGCPVGGTVPTRAWCRTGEADDGVGSLPLSRQSARPSGIRLVRTK
jgi:hypothetical protein